MPEFRLPGGADRTTVIGPTGSGKTVFGAWLLSQQRFNERPWVAPDFKDEELWDKVGDPPMRPLNLSQLPKKKGLYRLDVKPGQDEAFEDWLWKVWHKGEIGLFSDEVSLWPRQNAFKACLRQGRSRRIPIIACTQRPVDCDREVFSESQYIAIFSIEDERDAKIVKGFTRDTPIDRPLPPHHCYWFDRRQKCYFILKPCPPPDIVASDLKRRVPYSWGIFS